MDSNGHGHDHNGGSCSHSANMEEEEEKHRKEVQTAFANYSKDMKSSFEILFGEQKLIKYYELVRERKREKMEKALQANQAFLNLILDSVHSNQGDGDGSFVPLQVTACHNISKIRTTVKQFFREWCAESPEVKDYVLLVDKAKKYLKKKDKVLAPGCGLGRLPLELIEAGFGAQGNEVTYFMLYGSNFILNSAQKKQQYEIYPFIHSLNNHESEQNMFRSVKVPDKLAAQVVPEDADFSMAAGEFTEIYQSMPGEFQGVITCFFLDTANNVFQYVDTIYNVLQEDGIWINYGPLLYHFKDMLDQVSIELSWQQLRTYITMKGFIPLEEEQRETTYCHDPLSAYEHIYNATLSVWRKPKTNQSKD